MNKKISVTCFSLILILLSGCSLILGGSNRREMGEYMPVYTHGERCFFEYSMTFEDGLIMKTAEGFELSEFSADDESVRIKDSDSKLVLESYISALSSGADFEDGYECLYDELDSVFNFSDDDNFSQAKFFDSSGRIFGAVNFYSRPSGRSGSLLTHENIVKSVFVNFTDGEISVKREFHDTAILAFNESYCVIYRDKNVYSVNLTSGEEVLLFKDKWWDRGPEFYNQFEVSFTDEVFVAYAKSDNDGSANETLMVGNLDGTEFTTLIENREIKY